MENALLRQVHPRLPTPPLHLTRRPHGRPTTSTPTRSSRPWANSSPTIATHTRCALRSTQRCSAPDAHGTLQYLVESIRNFPRPDELADRMRQAGFRAVNFEQMTFGVVALHSGFKL